MTGKGNEMGTMTTKFGRTGVGLLVPSLAALLLVVAALLAFGAGKSSAATQTYKVTDLGGFYAKSVNDSGKAVGYRHSSGFNYQAVLAEAGQPLTELGALPGDTSSEAHDVNGAGQVVGTSGYDKSFLYENGQMKELSPPPGYSEPRARAINNTGQVVGSLAGDDFASHAFLYENDQMKWLYQGLANDINDAGQVAGEMLGAHASLYSNGRLKDLGTLPDQDTSRATALNDAGQVVGYAFNEPDGAARAFLYEGGQMKDLTKLAVSRPSGFTLQEAREINNRGTVVGFGQYGSTGNLHAFVYENGRAVDLNDAVPFQSGRLLEEAVAVNDDGSILASGYQNGSLRAYLLTPTLPSVALTAPGDGATVKGTGVALSASATDDAGVSRVDFYVGDQMVGSDDTAPYSVSWNSMTAADGQKAITARSYSTAGNELVSAPRTVTVDNTAPKTVIQRPANNSYDTDGVIVLSGTSEAGSSVRVSEGTVHKGTATASSTGSWSLKVGSLTNKLADGGYTYTAKATDAAGNISEPSNAVTVTVDTTKPRAILKYTHEILGTDFTGYFSEPMRASTINARTFTLHKKVAGGWSAPLDAGVTVDRYLRQAVLDPDKDLRCGQSYQVRMSTVIKDVAGNPLSIAYDWTFLRYGSCIDRR